MLKQEHGGDPVSQYRFSAKQKLSRGSTRSLVHGYGIVNSQLSTKNPGQGFSFCVSPYIGRARSNLIAGDCST